MTAAGHGVSLWCDANVLELDSSGGCERSKSHWTVHCKMVKFILCEFFPLQKMRIDHFQLCKGSHILFPRALFLRRLWEDVPYQNK